MEGDSFDELVARLDWPKKCSAVIGFHVGKRGRGEKPREHLHYVRSWSF